MDKTRLKKLIMGAAESLRLSVEGIPAGHLYAALMAQGVSYSDYQLIEDCLVKILYVKKEHYLLTWTEKSEALLQRKKEA